MRTHKFIVALATSLMLVLSFATATVGAVTLAPGDSGSSATTTTSSTSSTGSGSSGSPSSQITCDSSGTPCNQVTDPALSGNCSQGAQKCDLVSKYINPLITFLSVLVGLVVVASIIMGAIQYSSSGGNPQAAAAARKRIQNAIFALIAYIFLVAIMNFIVPGGLL